MGGNIVDVEENCRRGMFAVFLIIDFSASKRSYDEISAELRSVAEEKGLKIVLDRTSDASVAFPPHRENHLVTLLGNRPPGYHRQGLRLLPPLQHHRGELSHDRPRAAFFDGNGY